MKVRSEPRFAMLLALFVPLTGTSNAQAAQVTADLGLGFGGLVSNKARSGGDEPLTFGLWGTTGFGDAYVEMRALASSYRYFNADFDSNKPAQYPQYESTIYDLNFGLMYSHAFKLSKRLQLSPQLGGGFTAVNYKTRLFTGPSGQYAGESGDRSSGHYVHLGVSLLIKDKIRVGVDDLLVRGTHVQLFGQPDTANHDQLMLFVGYHWGEVQPAR